MFKFTVPVLVVAIVLVVGSVKGDERDSGKKPVDKPSVQESFSKIVTLGPGVHHIKADQDGHVRSCIVVGQSRISTVLGKAKGLHTARSRANLAAASEFVKWLKQDVEVRETTEDETILSLEGNRKEDKKTREESGKAVEKNTSQFTAISRGLVRGLQVLHVDVDGEEGVYTVVLGWSADGAAMARQAERDEDVPSVRSQARKPYDIDEQAEEIRSRKATSQDAGKFLE